MDLSRALSDVGEPVSLGAGVDLVLAVTPYSIGVGQRTVARNKSCACRRLMTRVMVCSRRC